ncbi:beta-glucosidase [Amylocystis lapponica]|nr:beta-glucosidase [Amylocystis lapponica]
MLFSAGFAALAVLLSGARAQSSVPAASAVPSPTPVSLVSSIPSVPTPASLVSSLPSVPTPPSLASSLPSVPTSAVSVVPAPAASGEPFYNSGSGTEAGWQTLPISSYAFASYPVASSTPIPGVFPVYQPAAPPPVAAAGSPLVPDFAPAWEAAYEKAEALVRTLDLEQKVNLTTGVGWGVGRCVGNIGAVGEFPGLCLEDSPTGVRYTNFNTAFPAGITVAATWNRTMMRLRGLYMGEEFRGKGVHVALGPMMNMGRVANAGRNWEGSGVDPYLSGEAAYETILGMQQAGVQACAKHYIDYEQEYKRTQESSNVDDRTNHEIYLKPFLRSVQAGVASVMCSYNMINDTYACENNNTLNGFLKTELGFRGYVMSDWYAQMSTLSAVSGLDMSMPGNIESTNVSYWGQNLTTFVMNETISAARLDDMSTRILAGWYLLGQDQNYPNVSFNAFYPNLLSENLGVDVQADHYKLVREIGAAGAVLLKNTRNALPLKAPRSLASSVRSDASDAPLGPNGYIDRGGDDGVLAMGWGSGSCQFPYLISPADAIQDRARVDGSSVTWYYDDWNTTGAADAVVDLDVAIVFANADSGEGYITVDGNLGDRNNLTLWNNADALIQAVAAQNNNTIVVVHSVGPSILEAWIEHPNVTALIWANIPGQEAGNSLVDVLYGAVNPSGRLPYTIAKNWGDYGVNLTLGGGNDTLISVPYTEGLFVDYRHFDQRRAAVRHVVRGPRGPVGRGRPTPAVEGSSVAIWLHRPAFQAQFEVTNTGSVPGAEIPQMYVHFPAGAGEPPALLRGFSDVLLQPGETQSVVLSVSRYDLSSWVLPNGTFALSVGASSRDFKLTGTIPI